MHSNEYEAFQNDVARIALAASAPYDFLLAGGKALQAHGLSQRPTEDIDIFTNQHDLTAFDKASASILVALKNLAIRQKSITAVLASPECA
ncbi:nucleotidyl transferase AbiEii/AbiGii toxin family protein [Corynebacterium cystitidis]|uniref:nucleotidyl transferase AbiEii/AbiGii toxin family protein n=1 Tax=Corynebacterium cystitidis TaxID=35757 RepID=UPI00211DD085|nr:nucleotidyl transferase AbiEii/AbiGii toxin family protein [Corynebacterium cystitidis]